MALNLDHQRDRITTASGNITINTNGSLRVPVGNTAQRPQAGSVATGQIRFNSQTAEYEGYNGSAWTSLGGASFQTISTAAGTADDIVAGSATDTLNFASGTGITITADPATKTITITGVAQYGNSDVDTHLNQSTAQTGEVLSWNGSDYDWVNVVGGGSSISDTDADTHIKTETNADEDIIRFTTAGTERANINATGVLTIGDSASATFYSFPTARGTNGQLLSIDANGVLNFIDAQIAELYYQNNAPTTGLNTGQLWFDTGTTGELYVYTGTEWISTTPGADTGFIKQNYTGNGNTTAFDTGTGTTGGTVSMVFVNGVLVQPTNDYTETGGIITFVNAPLNGDQIDVMITGSLVTLALNPLGLNNHNLITVDSSGELTVNSLVVSDLTDNRVVIAGTSGQIEDDANFTFDGTNLVVSTTGAVQLPAGTTAQRPGSAVNGMFRYNTNDNAFEGYANGAWGAIAGGGGIALTDLSVGADASASSSGGLSYNDGTGVFTYTPPDLSSYLTSYTETNDLTSAVVWANIPDTNVPQSAVTQHQAALSITESQISDLGTYLTAEADTLDDVIGRGATTTTTAVIPFYYANQAAFPNATTYHGAIGHSHSDGAMYFAHGGAWIKLANDSDIAVNTAGDSGSGTVNLSTQTLSVVGTTNEIQTSVTNQTVTIGLPTDVTVQGNLTVDTNTLYVDASNNRVGIGTATPSEALHVDGAIRVDGVSTLKTSTATVTSTNATTIDTFDASVDRSAKYIIQATDTVTGEYQIAEAVCIHDGNTAYITIYGIVYTGSAEIATYSANYSNVGEFELQATGASANSTVYKVTRVNTLV